MALYFDKKGENNVFSNTNYKSDKKIMGQWNPNRQANNEFNLWRST